MGRYASVDWIQFEWDEQRTGLGPGRTSLERTGGWYHQLGPWLDPGPEPGVSLCRLLVDGRVVVLARTRTGGADSRRTIRVQAYLGGSASQPMAMPNVRQTLALASGWAARLPDGDEPLDLGRLISSYDGARAALDRESRAAAPALAPIVSECLRRPGAPLSVASGGNPIVQLWGLVDILDLALGHYPETFSTYESDDLKQGAEIIFLRQWPGPSSQSSYRTRVDPRSPDQGDRCAGIAAMLVEAYARDQLVGLVKRLRISDKTPLEERLRRLASVTRDPTALVARPAVAEQGGDELVWSPQPPARSQPTAQPAPQPAAQPATQPTAQPAAQRAAQGQPPYQAAPAPPAAPPAHAPQPSQAASAQASTQASAQASPEAAAQAGQTAELQRPRAAGQAVQAQGTPTAQVRAAEARAGDAAGVRQYAEQDAFEMLCTDLLKATSAKEATTILQEMRAWAARRQPAEVRSRLPRLIPVLERRLPEGQINPVLRGLLDPDAHQQPRRPYWLDPKWLVIVAMLAVLVILVAVTLFLLV
ncbi:hypothetical protein HD597_007196 [Nonomuraea thailandensis]|uniref:Uncharacterized protein n=1 Tax=Nonomuraea thailandensis TaxID=1188745 RepID=A0A9X2K7V5_9ACTN|nr:hypothetical protein [Nonomuraea thailandensis]MCP2360176.1 hypothetical protein [Nonomuraea thailandensis]